MNDMINKNKRENFLEIVILALGKEIKNAVDSGKVSSGTLEEDGWWIDTDDLEYSIQVWLDWSKPIVSVNATAYPLLVNKKGLLQENNSAEEIDFLKIHLEESQEDDE
jgi:hypothetical protein